MIKIQYLLFDADAPLFDYDRAEFTALTNTLAQFGHPCPPETLQIYRRVNAQAWRDFERRLITAERLRIARFEALFAETGLALDPRAFSIQYLIQLSQAAELLDGALEVVQALSGGHRMAIITNGLKEVQRSRFERSTIFPYFAELIISDEVGVAKPDPGIFDIALRRLGNPDKQSVLVIGDSLSSDMRGGHNAGLATCWYNPSGQPRPAEPPITYEIRHLSELLPLLGAGRAV
jgi:2-haloacid dehalogenase